MSRVTLRGNFASEGGGALYGLGSIACTLRDSIFWQNGSPDGSKIILEGYLSDPQRTVPSIAIAHSDIQGGLDGILCREGCRRTLTDSIDQDPLFASIDLLDPTLNPDSPCIDAGDPSSPVDPDETRADMGSAPFLTTVPFLRGDSDFDGRINIADAIVIAWAAVGSGRSTCWDAYDANDDGRIDVADPIYLLGYLFRRGAPPPFPFPEKGYDGATPDELRCLP